MKLLFIATFCGFLVGGGLFAQDNADEVDLPPDEVISLQTSDGVRLRCHWYPGVNGKESIPVILVHDFGLDRSHMLPLAQFLQAELGCAVIVPDLRGHGESTQVEGADEPIYFDDFRRAEHASIPIDIDTCKKHLMKQNDAAELNIEMLTVVASHNSCIHAVNWAISDWAWPTLPDGTKQGQDVKTLILLSPTRKFKSGSMVQSLRTPLMSGRGHENPLLMVLFWGNQDEQSDSEARSIFESLQRGRPDPDDIPDDERWERQNLFRVPYDTGAIGEELFTDEAAANIGANIATVLQRKLLDNIELFQWTERLPD